VVPHPLAALDEAGIAHQAITPAAHAGQATAFEQSKHVGMMYRPAIPAVVQAVRRMEGRCRELGVTLPVAALAFVLTEAWEVKQPAGR